MNNLYLLGIPIQENFVSEQLTSFINEDVPTLYLYTNEIFELHNGYNFCVSNNFKKRRLDTLTEELIAADSKILCSVPNMYDFENANISTPRIIAKKFEEQLDNIQKTFPNTRIAFCTLGSPLFYNAIISRFVKFNSQFQIQLIDTQTFENSDSQHFYEMAMLLGNLMQEGYKNPTPFDRSGIFWPNASPSIPENVNTTKTFQQIADETALTYMGRNPIVAWSGGIDSTVAVSAFIKNNVPFKVTVSKATEKENPILHNYLINNYQTITLPDNNSFANITDTSVIVCGHPADQIYPENQTNFLSDKQRYKELIAQGENVNLDDYPYLLDSVPDELLYNNVREVFIQKHSESFLCTTEQSTQVFENYLLPKLNRLPIPINHFYQLKFFFRFIFNYHLVIHKQFKNGSQSSNEIVGFFDTPDFQRWAITNLDYNFENYGTYKNQKQVSKEYNYSVFNMPHLLEQSKYPSFLNASQNVDINSPD
jgi:hypothetical protein